MMPRGFKIYVDLRVPQCQEVEGLDAEKISDAATREFVKLSGLKLRTKDSLFFMADSAAQGKDGQLVLIGIIIDRDSVARRAAFSFTDKNKVAEPAWVHLPLEEIEKEIIEMNKRVRPNIKAPFPIRWERGWESAYPDLYLRIKLSNKTAETFLTALTSRFENHEQLGDFGAETRGKETVWLTVKMPTELEPDNLLQMLFHELASIEDPSSIKKVIFGMPIC